MKLYDQLQEKLEGHVYNGYFACLCQFHDDHKPSMFVYEDGFYSCKTCGARGTLAKLAKHLNLNTPKIYHSNTVLPRWRKWEENWGDLAGIAKHAHNSIKRYPDWMWYFKERKIEQFYEQGFFGYLDGFALFPVFNQEHKIENIVVRSTTKSDLRYAIKATDDKKPLLYVPNWQRVLESDTIYVVYGIVDSWAMEAIGKPCVTGITGKSLSAETLRPLNKHYIIVPDEYEERDAHLLANSLGWKARVKQLVYPEGTKDCDDLRRKFGNEYLLGALA